MAKWLALLLTGVLSAGVPALLWAQPSAEQLLQESGVELNPGDEFEPVAVVPNELFEYQQAFRTHDRLLERRVALRPLQRLEIEYQDPHNAAPEPNHIFPLIFDSLIGHLARSGAMPSREYDAGQARQKFNADWAAAAVFDVEPEFGGGYDQALLLALHRNNRADAYLVFLFDDYQRVKEVLNRNLSSLRFREGS